MKTRAFTLMETLLVVVISSIIFASLLSLFMVTRNSWVTGIAYLELQQKARLAVDRVANELSKSSPSVTLIRNCANPNECNGQLISFKIPVAPAGTYYDENGNIYWGADGVLKNEIQIFAKDYRLIRRVKANSDFGACCSEGICLNVSQSTCSQAGGIYKGDRTLCSTPYICTPGAPQPPHCFLSTTPVLMADGTTKAIEKIRPGDWVMAFDEKTKSPIKNRVSKLFTHESAEYLVINGSIKVTANHPVYSKGKWVTIGSLKIGASLLNPQGKEVLIKEVKKVKEKVKTYNLEVAPPHNYFAAGILAHNKVIVPLAGENGFGDGGPEGTLFWRWISPDEAFADTDTILATEIEKIEFSESSPVFKPPYVNISVTAKKTGGFVWYRDGVTIKSSVTFRN